MTDEQIERIIRQHATITDQNLYGAIYMMILAAVDAADTELERKSDAIQRLWKERDELRAALAKPERKPLTDAQIADLWHQTAGFHHHFARAVEAAHGVSGNA